MILAALVDYGDAGVTRGAVDDAQMEFRVDASPKTPRHPRTWDWAACRAPPCEPRAFQVEGCLGKLLVMAVGRLDPLDLSLGRPDLGLEALLLL